MEGSIFSKRVDGVFQLAKKEAYMTGIFWGASGLTGNLAMLCLLGYGEFVVLVWKQADVQVELWSRVMRSLLEI
jgi:hypothetical protein